jgi:ribosomal protein S18 acetylase RimI-like enzyme
LDTQRLPRPPVPALPAAVTSPELVRGLQERAARALPAEHVREAGGWWLRHAPGCAWWASTVLPHADAPPGELARRVADAEKFYAAHGATARFQITPGVCPAGLDALLAARGYRAGTPVSLRVAPAAEVTARLGKCPLPVEVTQAPDGRWFGVWYPVQGHGGDPGAERAMLARVGLPSAYALALAGGEVAAVGRAVAEDGWAGIFGMAALPAARGRGAGRSVLAALARWATGQRAAWLYLQVEPGNTAAMRLYARAGFTGLCTCHYRSAA